MLGKSLLPKLRLDILNKLNGNLVILLDDDAWDDAKKLYHNINVGRLHGKIRLIKLTDDYDIGKVQEDFGRKGVVEVLRSSYTPKEFEI
jgi:hypothetical protein